MARPKGIPKTGGRKRGTPNKVTGTVKEWLATIIDNNRMQFEKDLKSVPPLERLKVISSLLPYIIPKMQNVTAQIDFDKLTESELNNIINTIKEDNNDENEDTEL